MSVRVFVPRETTALSLGADTIARRLERDAAARHEGITLVRNGSRGLFWLEPMIEVETPKGRFAYGPVTPSDVPELLDSGLLEGCVSHPLALGRTDEIKYLARQQRLTFARIGITDPLSIDDYQAHRGFAGLEAALTLTPQAIVDEVKASGLRGRGGAAFPTGIKWQTVLDAPADQKYIVCNADEGDSGTFADRLAMECDPYMLIEGMTIAGLAVGATQGYIYLRSEYPLAKKSARRGHRPRRTSGLPGRRHSPERPHLPSGSPPGGRCLYLRRGNLATRKPGGQARPGALQTAATRHRGALRPPHRRQ